MKNIARIKAQGFNTKINGKQKQGENCDVKAKMDATKQKIINLNDRQKRMR